ncbi:DUF6961 family protein [Qipengyuania sp. CAU 1752]
MQTRKFIASKIDQLCEDGEQNGARLWQVVVRRYEQLAARKSHS